MSRPYFYLASPYTHPNAKVRELRFRAAAAAAGALMDLRIFTYVPIAMTHPIEIEIGPRPLEVWLDLDMPLLERSSGLIELALPGWQASKGMERERYAAQAFGLPIFLAEPRVLVPREILDALGE